MSDDQKPEGYREVSARVIRRVNELGLADPKASTKHGLYLEGFMPCRRCILRDDCEHAEDSDAVCRLEMDYFAARVRQLTGLSHVDPETDWPLVATVVWGEIRVNRGRRWLAAVGEFDAEQLEEGKLQYQHAATEVRRLQQAVLSTLEALGATPVARKKLEDAGDTGAGAEIAEILRILDERDQERRADAQDAEFEAEDEQDQDNEAVGGD